MSPAKSTPAATPRTTELKAIRVTLENKPGAFAQAARVLADAGINVEGVEAEVLGQYGFVRFYTSDEGRAEQALRAAGYLLTVSEILELDLTDRPGELARALEILAGGHVNCESVFGTSLPNKEMRAFMRVSDVGRAHKLLTNAQFRAYRRSH